QKLGRVHRRPALPHFEMQVRSGRPTRPSDLRNLAAPQYQVADLGQACGSVRVARNETVPVVDFDHITILWVEIGVDDNAAGGRVDGGSLLRDHVYSFVEGVLPVEWIDAPAVVRRVPAALYRQHGGYELFARAVERQG